MPRVVVLHLHEWRAELSEVVRADADTVVAHPEMQSRAKPLDADRDLAAVRRKLDGIGNEVDQYLLDGAAVAIDLPDIVAGFRFEPDCLRLGLKSHHRMAHCDRVLEPERLGVDRVSAGLDL